MPLSVTDGAKLPLRALYRRQSYIRSPLRTQEAHARHHITCPSNSCSHINSFKKKRQLRPDIRKYSTDAKDDSPKDEETDADESDEKPKDETLASKYGLDPKRERYLEYMKLRKELPIMTEEEKKIVRHIVKPNGTVIFPDNPFMTKKHLMGRKVVAIAGGHGYLGDTLRVALVARGHMVKIISTRAPPEWPFVGGLAYQWYQITGEDGVPDCDALVQLTGHPYLSKDNVPTLNTVDAHYNSRGGITELLAHHMNRTRFPPLTFIQASHSGIYPASNEMTYDEQYSGPTSDDLIGFVSKHYEQKSELLKKMDMRTIQMRLGHVIGERGFVHNVHRVDKKGRAFWTRIGSGEQWLPWIHVKDACNLIIHAIENDSIHGVVNGVAPQLIQQHEFATELKNCLPKLTLKIPMTETATNWMFPHCADMLLEGRRVTPNVAVQTGFQYEYPTIQESMLSIKKYLIPVQWKNPANRHLDPAKF